MFEDLLESVTHVPSLARFAIALIVFLIVPALFLFGTLRDTSARPASATLLALVALLPASGLTLNQFGLDGAALWSLVPRIHAGQMSPCSPGCSGTLRLPHWRAGSSSWACWQRPTWSS